jgi:hypothetical protein
MLSVLQLSCRKELFYMAMEFGIVRWENIELWGSENKALQGIQIMNVGIGGAAVRCSALLLLLDCKRKVNLRESRCMSVFVIDGGDRLDPVNRPSPLAFLPRNREIIVSSLIWRPAFLGFFGILLTVEKKFWNNF